MHVQYQVQYTKRNKNTTQYVLATTIRQQTQTRHAPSYIQLEVKTNLISFLWGNRNGQVTLDSIEYIFPRMGITT